MAFFPIVIRKVGGYVALHDEIKARWNKMRDALRDSEGRGRVFGTMIRPEATERRNPCMPKRNRWQCRTRRRADVVSEVLAGLTRSGGRKTLIEIKIGFDSTR